MFQAADHFLFWNDNFVNVNLKGHRMPVPPSDASAARLARIVRLSRIMAGVLLVMIAGLPVLLVLVAVFGSGGVDGLLLEALNAPATGSLDASSRAALLLLAAVPLGRNIDPPEGQKFRADVFVPKLLEASGCSALLGNIEPPESQKF